MNILQYSITKIALSLLIIVYHLPALTSAVRPTLVAAIHDKLHNFDRMKEGIDQKRLKLQSTYTTISSLQNLNASKNVKQITLSQKDLIMKRHLIASLFITLDRAYEYFHDKLVVCQNARTHLCNDYDFSRNENIRDVLLNPRESLKTCTRNFKKKYPTIHQFLIQHEQLFDKIIEALDEYRNYQHILRTYAKTPDNQR